MNKDDILVLRPLYQMKDYEPIAVRLDIKEQLKRGKVVTIPFGWDVVTKPADTKVEVTGEPEEAPTPWDFVERLLFCTECGITINHYDHMYQYCPYCGKRHYFEEVSE